MKAHDNVILSYQVSLINKSLHFKTLNENKKSVDIFFSDVLVHYFQNELCGSVILDILSLDINNFYMDNIELLEKRKNNCWPINYNNSTELNEYLINNKYNYYEIASSYGLSGWILAKNYTIDVIEI